MTRKIAPLGFLLAAIALSSAALLASAASVYGHISFVENGAMVLRQDGERDQAGVNLPLAPGDTVITSGGGRCELQFDNGTVIRLDKGSRLRLATVLAPSLTSNWKITTLELERGQLYALPQTYGLELFQVVTPLAAVNLKSRVRATIRLDDGGGVSFFSDGGRFELLYGADSRSLKRAAVRSGMPVAVSAGHALSAKVEPRGLEFTAWNEFVDRHFQELHRGISKVPPKLKFGNPALTYWAEKWSSLYGEWIYDELFGYVWRPADERFAHSARPFFHAGFTRVGGQLFLVPQQPWGWVPAHMGTWVWMKRGWTWVPGDWFHSGCVDYRGLYAQAIDGPYYGFPTFDYFWRHYFHFQPGLGNQAGEPGWPNRPPKKPELPGQVVTLIKRVLKAPDSSESRRLATGRETGPIEGVRLPTVPKAILTVPRPGIPATDRSGNRAGEPDRFVLGRDWNPDSRWALRRRVTIHYDGNAVKCPELGASSDDRASIGRARIREAVFLPSSGQSSGSQGGQGAGDSAGARAGDGGQGHAGERVRKDDGK